MTSRTTAIMSNSNTIVSTESDAASLDALAIRAQGGDQEAFVSILEATERDIRIFVTCYATNLAMVDEVVQAAYVTAYQNLARYEPRGTLRGWLKGIARNGLRKELDQRRRLKPLADEVLEEVLVTAAYQDLASEDDRPERQVQRLQFCLAKLAPEARRLVEARYYQDHPVEEIARLFDRSHNWVAVGLFRVRRALQKCLAAAENAAGAFS